MKRIQEKVKDIVEVRPYKSIRDFTADPAETLSNYHFTDATSDLMAKWLDGISSVQPDKGAAFALAGYRGVGKSHFLATLGALVSHPDLRSRVSESHVAFSAQNLLRRHYPIAYIRRGTHETLLEEFRTAISTAFELHHLSANESFAGILKAASTKCGELPFVLMIDTAFERGTRVVRDDGMDLSAIADAAKELNVFVGVALDDDIAGADGSNSAIVRSFTIDYLDQGHLYKVVNSHIFPKHNQMQPVLHEIYEYFREVLPSFRWSEQKFAALYPLHPAILEVAPFVRLYVHDFALLGFASEAGEKILGRPANSLIALDEVYDSAEHGLRKIDELNGAFAAYDKLNSTVVNKIPVMQRLQAKLILKALLLLSLDGQGSTPNDICASVLIFDESDPQKVVKTVDELIKTFAEAMPEDIRCVSENGLEPRYSFKVAGKESLNVALAEAIADVTADTVPTILRRILSERFADSEISFASNQINKDWMDCRISWRGALRHGRILWTASDSTVNNESPPGGEFVDWEVYIDLQNEYDISQELSRGTAKIIWKPDPLRKDEIEKILGLYVLITNDDLRSKFSDQIRAALHSYSLSAEKILNRTFLEDGRLLIDGFDYNFTEEARSAQLLSGLFSIMLEPLFETRYPSHPFFSAQLGDGEVAAIVTDLYNSTRQNLVEVQNLARDFALPLGLVCKEGGVYVPETGNNLATLPLVSEILNLATARGGTPVLLDEVYSLLLKPPFGLAREAAQLMFTALVAQRQLEFVTSSGDRISRRSLDLKIIWDDIVGVATPLESSYSVEKLERWGIIFAGDAGFSNLGQRSGRECLRSAFEVWADKWKKLRLLDRFTELPDDSLNLRTWHLAARTAKTFGSVADSIEAASEERITLEECLERIADAFFDSETEHRTGENELQTLDTFIKGAGLRNDVRCYLAGCELTEEAALEELRDRLIDAVKVSFASPSDHTNRELGYLWEKFRKEFSAHYAERHAEIMKSKTLLANFQSILKSDEWWEFTILSELEIFEPEHRHGVADLVRQLNELNCSFDLDAALQYQPLCSCSFTLRNAALWKALPQSLNDAIGDGLTAYRTEMFRNRNKLLPKLEQLYASSNEKDVSDACTMLANKLAAGGVIKPFNDIELKIFAKIVKRNGEFSNETGIPNYSGTSLTTAQIAESGPGDSAVIQDDAVLMQI